MDGTRRTPRADLERLHAVVPVRSLQGGKARLGEVLDPEEREALIAGLLRHSVQVLQEVPTIAAVTVVSTDAALLDLAARDGATPLRQRGTGLNEALREAREAVATSGATALLIVPGDLPWVTRASVERLIEAADAALAAGSGQPLVAIAPADARNGTNALLLAPVDVIDPCFGAQSFEAHARAAAASGASLQVVVEAGLGFDLDTPDDLGRIEPPRLQELISLGAEALAEATPS